MADSEESMKNIPVFGSPCRIFEMNEDPINRKCKRILGNYELMQNFISDFIYISSQERPEILHNFPDRRLDVSYRGIGPFTKNMQPDVKVPPMRHQKTTSSLISANKKSKSVVHSLETHDNECKVNMHSNGNHNKIHSQILEPPQTLVPSTVLTSFNQAENTLTPINFDPVKSIDLNIEIPTDNPGPTQSSLLPASGQAMTLQKNGVSNDVHHKPEQQEIGNGKSLITNMRKDSLKGKSVEEIFRLTIVKSALEPPLSPISSPVNEWENSKHPDQSLSRPVSNKPIISLQTIFSEIITNLKPISPIQSPTFKNTENNDLEPGTEDVGLNDVWPPLVDELNIKQKSENMKDWKERHILEPQYSQFSVVKQSSRGAYVSDNKNTSVVSVHTSPAAPIYDKKIKYGIEEINKKLYYPRSDSYSVEIMTKTEKYLSSLDNIANCSLPKERKDLPQGFNYIKSDKSVMNERKKGLTNMMEYNFNMSKEQKCSMTVHQVVPHVNAADENKYIKQTKYTYINEIQDEKSIKIIAKESPLKELSYKYQYKTEHQSPSHEISFANTSEMSPLKITFSSEKVLENKFSKDGHLRQMVDTQEFVKPYATGTYQKSLRPCLNIEKDISAALIFSSPKYKVSPFDIFNHRCSLLRLPIYSLTQREKKLVIKIPLTLLDSKLKIKMKSKFDENYKKRMQHSYFSRKNWNISIMVKIKTILLHKIPYCCIQKDIKTLRSDPYPQKHRRIKSEGLFNTNTHLLGSGLLETHCFNDSGSYNARANYLKDQAKIMQPAAQKFLNLMSAMWYIMCGHRMEEERVPHNSVVTFFQTTFEFLGKIGHFNDSRMEALKLLLQTATAQKIYLLRNFKMKQLKIDLTKESKTVFGKYFPSQQFGNYIQQHSNLSQNENFHSIIVSRRWLSLNNDYVEIIELLVQSNQFWMESQNLMQENKEFFKLFGNKWQTLSLNGHIPTVVDFVKDCLELLQPKELKIYTEFQKHIQFENDFI
ncbi:Hypothetical predicted protein [Octopus vulgaris]|uniref:AF4/FMR2 C-terminal homology domain-containing protein n=1 Tax=Octopus vulgaris TaxID=6645 RepID=A0AA36BPN1_OCTVU|nr:Hypothetical predicted protein [Octopus vulgaris]